MSTLDATGGTAVAVLPVVWDAVATAVVLAAVLRRRPVARGLWWALAGYLLLTTAGSALTAVTGLDRRVVDLAVVASPLVGLSALVPFAVRGAAGAGSSGARRAARRSGRRQTLAVLAGAAVPVAYVATSSAGAATGAWDGVVAATTAGLGSALLAVLAWLVLSRPGAPLSSHLVVAGAAASVVHHSPLLPPGPAPALLGSAAAALWAAAALVPSMPVAGAPRPTGPTASPVVAVVVVAAQPLAVVVVDALRPHPLLPGPAAVLVCAAVTAAALAQVLLLLRAAERRSSSDALTGLLNRRGLDEHLARTTAPAWAVVVDLDGFKEVNDRWGHGAGDELLAVVGAAVRRAVAQLPAGCAGAARTGGDEFVVVVGADRDEVAEDRARLVAELLVAEPHELPRRGGWAGARVTASAGTARVGAPDDDGGRLADADLAAYAAKEAGGGRWLPYAPALREEARARAELRRGVRDLLSTPAGEPCAAGRLVVRYQPVVAVADGRPLGVEALVRWAHPELGEVPPDGFLPLVEAAGLGAELDRRVLEEALHQVAVWDAQGAVVHRVGVNLGAGSTASPTLAQDVLDACARTGVGPERLLLEVTEHTELRAGGPAGAALQRLALAGASVALDDFGAGYAGVGPLLHLPVALLKLDRSLLPLRPERPPGAADPVAVLAGVLALAAAAGLEVTAEGVETDEQLALLRHLGVAHAQGWLFARALDPVGVVAHWRAAAALPAS